MQTDKYTKVVLTLIAIGIFLNLAMYLRVTPAGAASEVLEANLVRTKKLEVVNDDGKPVLLAQTVTGGGWLMIMNERSQIMFSAGYEEDGGRFSISNNLGHEIFVAGPPDGNGLLNISDKSGRVLIKAGAALDGAGGVIAVDNKTGQSVVTLGVDDYGNGEVGAWNRKGKGKVFDSK